MDIHFVLVAWLWIRPAMQWPEPAIGLALLWLRCSDCHSAQGADTRQVHVFKHVCLFCRLYRSKHVWSIQIGFTDICWVMNGVSGGRWSMLSNGVHWETASGWLMRTWWFILYQHVVFMYVLCVQENVKKIFFYVYRNLSAIGFVL